MSTKLEHSELEKFYLSVNQDIKSIQLSDIDGGNLSQIFTQLAVDALSEAGETENARVAYDEGQFGTRNQHQINAYAEPDNYETIDLFVTVFKGGDEIMKVGKEEIETAGKRISNFFRKAKYKDYVNEIEESSPIFDFAHTLGTSAVLKENLVRVNAIILTDGIYSGAPPESHEISQIPVYYRVIDINYLYNLAEKSHVAIEIDFKKDGFEIPCIISPSTNDQYQSYLAIIPGPALANIYERFGSRLLEQNVRSFLQFTGKINNGIRKTIKEEPHMFLAFNNGIAATAESLSVEISDNGKGFILSKVTDFQIVNGGQTTASIYHTLKKDKADISGIFVQVKLSVVKNKERFGEIVSRIAEYANTQNKVSVSDLSSNRPFHIELEKISRTTYTPHTPAQSTQTRWFYERARGQYKNAKSKEGSTARQKAFDLKNPKSQLFTKEELAKYVNAYQEIYDGKKLVIGPYMVVRGNQKNYVQFINYNLIKKVDSVYFEDVVAKAIIFRSAEKIYGVKPNSIGDMRYITVPYSIALLSHNTNSKLDLYKIWRNQAISENLKGLLYDLMVKVETFIKTKAPGSLYGEWAKKEDCWNELKKQNFGIDFKNILKDDFEDSKSATKRKRATEEEISQVRIQEEYERIKSLTAKGWSTIENWGRTTGLLTEQQKTHAFNLAGRIRNNTKISDIERNAGLAILDIVLDKAPGLLDEIDELKSENIPVLDTSKITLELINKIIVWEKRNKRLKDFEFKLLLDVSEGKKTLTEKDLHSIALNFERVKKFGFSENNEADDSFTNSEELPGSH